MQLTNLDRGAAIIKKALIHIPTCPGVYKMLDKSGKPIYIGKAKDLSTRVTWYTKIHKLPYRFKNMVSLVQDVEIITTNTEAEALILEANLIKNTKPYYNIMLKDDKSFSYIAIDEIADYPRIFKHRGKKHSQYRYFGPFPSAEDVKRSIDEIKRIFKIRTCSDTYFAARERPCLQYQINRCSAPCVNKLDKPSYKKLVNGAIDFLSGRSTKVQKDLTAQMLEASERLEFETAAQLRDRILALSRIQAKNTISGMASMGLDDVDVISLCSSVYGCCLQILFIRNGMANGMHNAFFWDISEDEISKEIESIILRIYISTIPVPPKIMTTFSINIDLLHSAFSSPKPNVLCIDGISKYSELFRTAMDYASMSLNAEIRKKLKHIDMLQSIQALFNLENAIKRVEVYDNSHIQGENAVGCYIVAGQDGFIKNQYKVFKIKSTELGDDYAMLSEVLKRRIKHLSADNVPDLMLIDGGYGHFQVARTILKDTAIPYVCIAKGVDRNAGREYFFSATKEPFQLPIGDKTLAYLQALRDEAHRFAITTHRRLRSKNITKSGLDAIAGIGPRKKRLLLTYFGSMDAIKAAALSDLMRVPGISKKNAEQIVNFLSIRGRQA